MKDISRWKVDWKFQINGKKTTEDKPTSNMKYYWKTSQTRASYQDTFILQQQVIWEKHKQSYKPFVIINIFPLLLFSIVILLKWSMEGL